MYKIVGADGKEYGPVTLEQIQRWIAEGRVNAQTEVRAGDPPVGKRLVEFPELAALLPTAPYGGATPAGGTPAPMPSGMAGGAPAQGLAITSLVLGILAVFGCTVFTGIPAVICGHIARSRALNEPDRYGGEGLALGGLITGYLGLVLPLLILPALLLPALSKAKGKAQSVVCISNMRQVGMAFKQWEVDHQDQFPWGVSVTNGGTMELTAPDADHIESNPVNFQVLSNELFTPRVLVCPGDKTHTAASRFQTLGPGNISYQLHTGSNVSGMSATQILMTCPIHGNVLRCDGSVQSMSGSRRRVY